MTPETPANPNQPFGPQEDASQTQQAQHMAANDTPVDVNFNAVAARSQFQTVDVYGKEFAAAAARRNIIADQNMPKAVAP